MKVGFSVEKDGSAATTGWQGALPPKPAQEEVLRLYESGEIKATLATFYPVGCSR